MGIIKNLKVTASTCSFANGWELLQKLHLNANKSLNGEFTATQGRYFNSLISIVLSLDILDWNINNPWNSFFTKIQKDNSMQGLEPIYLSMLSIIFKKNYTASLAPAISLLNKDLVPTEPAGNIDKYIFLNQDKNQVFQFTNEGLIELFNDVSVLKNITKQKDFITLLEQFSDSVISSNINVGKTSTTSNKLGSKGSGLTKNKI